MYIICVWFIFPEWVVNFGEETEVSTGFTGGMSDCQTPDGVMGTCVFLTQCPSLADLLTVPSPGVLNYLRQSICGYQGYDPNVINHFVLLFDEFMLPGLLCLGVLPVFCRNREYNSVFLRRASTSTSASNSTTSRFASSSSSEYIARSLWPHQCHKHANCRWRGSTTRYFLRLILMFTSYSFRTCQTFICKRCLAMDCSTWV